MHTGEKHRQVVRRIKGFWLTVGKRHFRSGHWLVITIERRLARKVEQVSISARDPDVISSSSSPYGFGWHT